MIKRFIHENDIVNSSFVVESVTDPLWFHHFMDLLISCRAPQNDLKEKYVRIVNVIPCITHAQGSVDC